MIGIDAVDVERLRSVMRRSEGVGRRIFTEAERNYCQSMPDPVVHFAGTLAVKEAVIKAARLGPLWVWGPRIEVRRDASGVPRVEVAGATERRFEISISHDGPVAVAVAVSTDPAPTQTANGNGRGRVSSEPKPNLKLMSYLSPLGVGSNTRLDLCAASVCFAGTDFP